MSLRTGMELELLARTGLTSLQASTIRACQACHRIGGSSGPRERGTRELGRIWHGGRINPGLRPDFRPREARVLDHLGDLAAVTEAENFDFASPGPHRSLLDPLLGPRHHDPVHVDAGRVDPVRIELADLHEALRPRPPSAARTHATIGLKFLAVRRNTRLPLRSAFHAFTRDRSASDSPLHDDTSRHRSHGSPCPPPPGFRRRSW